VWSETKLHFSKELKMTDPKTEQHKKSGDDFMQDFENECWELLRMLAIAVAITGVLAVFISVI